jgi:perosamine synthetase
MSIPIYKSYLPPKSLAYAHDAIDSTWVSSKGKYIDMVRNKLQELLNVKYVLPLHNGTHAMHLIAKCLSKKGITKLIVPNNVYVAAWNGFLYDGEFELFAIEPDLATWNFDLDELDKAIKLHQDAAVLVVHNVGNIINVPKLQAKYPSTRFVEDNCEGFGGKYDGQYSGTASFASAASFYGNKLITSGEGGIFITNDEASYEYAKLLHSQGQSNTKFLHNELGYNYRMTNIQAALLYGQLEVLPEIVERKQVIFERYRAYLKDREDIVCQVSEAGTEPANWMFGVRLPKKPVHWYGIAEYYFKKQDIEIRPIFFSIDQHEYMRNNTNVLYGDCTKGKLLHEQCFILPSYPELTEDEQRHILKTLDVYVKSYISQPRGTSSSDIARGKE